MNIQKYFSILIEWNLESLGGERFLFFDQDRGLLFQDFSTYLKNNVSVFIDHHSGDFSFAECGVWCEQYPEIGLNQENWKYDAPLKILNHIIETGKQRFISNEDVNSFFSEIDDLLDWISNVPSYPNRDFFQISIFGNYPEFIEKWYRQETIAPVLPLQYNLKIGDSSYSDENATIIGWLCILINTENWYEKPDAVKFISQLVDRFNKRHAFV